MAVLYLFLSSQQRCDKFGHKGLDSKQGTQGPSWRQAQLRSTSQPPPANTAARPVSLDMNPRTHPPSPILQQLPSPPPAALTSLICIPVISCSEYQPRPSHPSITPPKFCVTATLWPQL
ncbi:unnamed protein product [Pleuronectes platessa]|uniref:Uncharacterized protein n=1 Tax=Pleuronectes platessa TaxID=8262 RepID=A0A9N7U2Z6_PLEPL|nr:unnamed protein product [Pleuronectes platessa]